MKPIDWQSFYCIDDYTIIARMEEIDADLETVRILAEDILHRINYLKAEKQLLESLRDLQNQKRNLLAISK
jgi:hypothetical protein